MCVSGIPGGEQCVGRAGFRCMACGEVLSLVDSVQQGVSRRCSVWDGNAPGGEGEWEYQEQEVPLVL